MKRNLTLSLALLMACFVAGNLHAQVKSDYDKTVDFSKFKTYTFKGWEKNSDQILNEFDKKRIADSFSSELSSRGLEMDDSNPEVEITLYVVIDEKTSTTAYTNYNGGMGYGRAGYGWGMGMGSSTTTYSENDYKQGTLVIDFYDHTSKKLIWQGVLTTVVKDKPEKREKTIPKNIKKLMKKYPIDPVK